MTARSYVRFHRLAADGAERRRGAQLFRELAAEGFEIQAARLGEGSGQQGERFGQREIVGQARIVLDAAQQIGNGPVGGGAVSGHQPQAEIGHGPVLFALRSRCRSQSSRMPETIAAMAVSCNASARVMGSLPGAVNGDPAGTVSSHAVCSRNRDDNRSADLDSGGR
jgi:hypothetical protein